MRLAPDGLDREANHRIANNLSVLAGLVRLHAAQATSRADNPFSGSEVSGLLDEIGARIDTVGRLHRLLSSAPAGTAMNLGVYLADTAETLVASMA
ncbi:MAG TPA: histidine kinase dimerization/phosphoacceptor domain -containing protein, partial [Caulobacteraceae bacterium]